MKQGKHRFLFRFPRIAAIVFILFISMFALDIFGNGYTFRQTVVGLFMHLIPTWILLIVLILSRKRYPLVGAIGFGGFGIGYTVICVTRFIMTAGYEPTPYYLIARPLIVALPALIIGFMFFRYRRLKRKGKIVK